MSALRPGVRCAILAGMKARASEVFVGTRTRARGARARARRDAGGDAVRPSSSQARRASARPGSPPRSRGVPATPGSRSSLGRSIDLVGTELPYQPFVEALRPLGEPWQAARRTAGSQLRVFEETLALLDRARRCCARAARARGSALGRYLDARSRRLPRAQPRRAAGSAARDLPRRRALVGRAHAEAGGRGPALGLGARARARSARARDELTALLAAHADASLPAAVADTIVARSEGNPFFAEELLAAADDDRGELPRGLRDLLLQRVARLDRSTQSLLRLAAAAGRDVGYPLLRAVGGAPRARGARVAPPGGRARRPRRRAGDEQLPLPPCAARGGDLRDDPARGARGAPRAARRRARPQRTRRRRRSSRRTGRRRVATTEAFAASVEAARQAEAVFGLAEAHAHLERALALWGAVPDAAELAGLDLAGALHADRRARQPDRCRCARGRARPASDRRSSARATRTVRPCSMCASASTSSRPEVKRLASPQSSGRSSSCRRSRRRRSAHMRWRRSRGCWGWPGAMRSRCRSASRRSRSLEMSARARRKSERSRCSAATSPISAAARRGSPIFVRPYSSPRRSAISSAWSEHGPISPMC